MAGPWQAHVIERVLMHDDAGDLLVQEALASTGRQNGKTTIVRIIMGWMLDEGIKLPAFQRWIDMLAAAHDAGQARVVYRAVQRDMLKLHVPTYLGGRKPKGGIVGDQERLRITDYFGIEINGLTLDTATSQPGSARGMSPGLIAWDEMLTQRNWAMWEALSPAQSAIRNALMLLTSTAGYADSVVLRALFERGLRQITGAERADPSFYMAWWCADDDEVGLDWKQLKKANPALDDGRLSRKRITSEYETSRTNPAMWVRERLNRWADDRVEPAFSLEAWGACRERGPLESVPGPYTLAVDCTADLTQATIAVAAMRPADGRVGVELHRMFDGTPTKQIRGSDVAKVIGDFAAKHEVKNIVYPASSAIAGALARHEALTGLPYMVLAAAGIPPACADFAEAVGSRRLAHDDPVLDEQMAYAQRRFIGNEGGWRWAVTASPGPITAVQSATLASSVAARVPTRAQVFFP